MKADLLLRYDRNKPASRFKDELSSSSELHTSTLFFTLSRVHHMQEVGRDISRKALIKLNENKDRDKAGVELFLFAPNP